MNEIQAIKVARIVLKVKIRIMRISPILIPLEISKG